MQRRNIERQSKPVCFDGSMLRAHRASASIANAVDNGTKAFWLPGYQTGEAVPQT